MSKAVDLVRQGLSAGMDKAITVNTSMVQAYIDRARRSHPEATSAELVASLEKQFMAAVASMGAVAGATAAAPGISTGPALAVNLVEVSTFLEASVLFILAVAEAHDVQVQDLERRRTLVYAVLLGNSGAAAVEKIAGRTGPYWAKGLVSAIPMSAVNRINKVLGPRFLTKYGTKQGILVLGRELPFGLGAVLGAGGNAVVGRATIRATRRAFGPPPEPTALQPQPAS